MSRAEQLDRQPTLTGSTLVLRPLGRDDFEALYAVAKDPLIWEQHPESTRWQKPVFERFFQAALVSGGALVVLESKTRGIIGSSRYVATDTGDVEIGWTFLDRAYWGGPTNRELKWLMLDHAFASVDSVIFTVGESNFRSRKAVAKLGATLDGVKSEGSPPSVIYRLNRSSWTG